MHIQDVLKEDIDFIVDSIRNEASTLEGKTVLVTGGAGFLGNYIVGTLEALNRKALKKPCRILVLDNYITGSRDYLFGIYSEHVEFIEYDIRDPLPEGMTADYVMHAAGIASPAYYQKFPLKAIEAAVNGTKNLLEFTVKKDVQSILFFSSSEIYGDPHQDFIPTPETYWGNVSSIGPRACYDESKRLGETLCITFHQLYRAPIKIVRPFNIYGPGMKVDDYRVMPAFMGKGLRGEPLMVYGHGNQTRTFCYISDAIIGLFKVLLSGRDGEVYNVGNDEDEMGMLTLAEEVNKVLPKSVEIKRIKYPDTYPAGEPERRCPDLTKIRSELGYDPKIDIGAGLLRTLAWFRSALGT